MSSKPSKSSKSSKSSTSAPDYRALAEARRARRDANRKQAAWMRAKGLVPNGAAWDACSAGERSVKVLRALQASEGVTPKPVTEPVAERQPKQPERVHHPRSRKGRKAAGRKGYAARVEAGKAQRNAKGQFVAASEAVIEAPVERDEAAIRAQLREVGLTDAQIKAALRA